MQSLRSSSLRGTVLAIALLTGVSACAPDATAPEERATSPSVAAVEALIWEKELAIFAGRGNGTIEPYLNSASDAYLGWPPVLPAPTNLDALKASADAAVALQGEVSNLSRKGFSLTGDTALMYFLNHRTRLGDGMADEGERAVDEYYENIHVWQRQNNDWQLIGGFARRMAGPRE
ncbi:MAG: hypothetical protein AAGC71_18460 [Pseudomonadota bacterium]